MEGDRRISVDIPPDLYTRLTEAVPYGLRCQVYQEITKAIVELFERKGRTSVGFLCAGYFEIRLKSDDEIVEIEEKRRASK